MTNSEVRILKLLLSRKGEKPTIKGLAEALEMNYRIAYENVMKLQKAGLVRITKTGNSRICEFTNRFDHLVFEAEYGRKKDLLTDKDFLVLHNRLAELRFPFIALLFGSRAKGTAGRHSDIDILAIGGDEKEIGATLSLLPQKTHLTNVTYGEFVQMARSKEFTVVSEAVKNNIILIGIEEYYRLMKNAGEEEDQ